MSRHTLSGRREPWRPPLLGQRIVKTTVAVLICLLFYCLRGYRGQDMPTEAAITAIVCMQPYVRDSRDYAINRFTATLIGAVWGLLLLLLLVFAPTLGQNLFILYTLMALGVMASLYTAVAVRKPDASGLAAIVFICVVIAFPEIDDPLRQAAERFLGVLLGTTVAILVNVFRLPREKNRDLVFFIRTKDLAPDRFSPIPSAALFRLNYLYRDGAKICLMSEHAPAFFSLQMSDAMLNLPLIVMDGAAIYDAKEDQYLHTEALGAKNAQLLREHLDRLGVSYFVYTVRKNRTCIFHRGPLSEQEKIIYDRMRRSPYRSYLEEESYELSEVVYFKMIGDEAQTETVRLRLESFLQSRKLRAVVRPEAGASGVSALYVYAESATMQQAEERLMQMLRKKEPSLQPMEILLYGGYHSEYDAMSLLHRLGNAYAPVKLFRRRKKAEASTDDAK